MSDTLETSSHLVQLSLPILNDYSWLVFDDHYGLKSTQIGNQKTAIP